MDAHFEMRMENETDSWHLRRRVLFFYSNQGGGYVILFSILGGSGGFSSKNFWKDLYFVTSHFGTCRGDIVSQKGEGATDERKAAGVFRCGACPGCGNQQY